MDLHGVLQLERLRVASNQMLPSQSTNLSLDIAINDGQLQLQPYRLTMYEGSIDTRAYLDVRGDEPLVTVDKTINGIQLEPLLQDMINTARAKAMGWVGSVDLTTNLSSHGKQSDILRQNLNGSLKLVINNGSIQGIDLVDSIRESYLAVMERRQPVTSIDEKSLTHFSKLTATGTVNNGILENKDLLVIAPNLKVTGEGKVDLAHTSVDYLLEADVVTSLRDMSIQNIENFQGLLLPIRLRGDFKTLKVPDVNTIDFSRMLRSAVAMPMLKKALGSSEWKGKMLKKLETFENRSGNRNYVNDILKQLMRIKNRH